MGKSKSPLTISRYNTQKRLKSMKKSNCVRPPQPKEAVRQLLPVIKYFLLFRF